MVVVVVVVIFGGSLEVFGYVMVLVISNLLGLVCDLVVGFVEIFCVMRNVIGLGNVLILVDLVLVGIESRIFVDEVIEVMDKVGCNFFVLLCEIGLGGLVGILIGEVIKCKIFGIVEDMVKNN